MKNCKYIEFDFCPFTGKRAKRYYVQQDQSVKTVSPFEYALCPLPDVTDEVRETV